MKCALVLLLTACGGVANAQPVYRCEVGFGQVAYQDSPCTQPPEDNDTGYYARPLRVRFETHAEASRVQVALKHLNDHKTDQYAENRRSCEAAARIAALCGNFGRRFSCDEKGFRPESVTQAKAAKVAGIDDRNAYKIEQCALRAAMGRP